MTFWGLSLKAIKVLFGSYLSMPKNKPPTTEQLCVLLNISAFQEAQVLQARRRFLVEQAWLQEWTHPRAPPWVHGTTVKDGYLCEPLEPLTTIDQQLQSVLHEHRTIFASGGTNSPGTVGCVQTSTSGYPLP